MSKSRTPDCDRLPAEAQPFAREFLKVAKPYTATEVARVLTNRNHGVDYMGCGKDHCAAAYAEAMIGVRHRPGLANMTMQWLTEALAAERKRLEDQRQRKADNEARWQREAQERAAHRDQRSLAADRWEALVKYDLLNALWESGQPVNIAELTALVDAKLAEPRP